VYFDTSATVDVRNIRVNHFTIKEMLFKRQQKMTSSERTSAVGVQRVVEDGRVELLGGPVTGASISSTCSISTRLQSTD